MLVRTTIRSIATVRPPKEPSEERTRSTAPPHDERRDPGGSQAHQRRSPLEFIRRGSCPPDHSERSRCRRNPPDFDCRDPVAVLLLRLRDWCWPTAIGDRRSTIPLLGSNEWRRLQDRLHHVLREHVRTVHLSAGDLHRGPAMVLDRKNTIRCPEPLSVV